MGILPIITNNPILKLFQGDRTRSEDKTSGQTDKPSAQNSDIVEISRAAREKLQGIQNLSSDDPDKIHSVTVETKNLLAQNEVTLGR
jgi:hypothetical protein